MERKYRISLCVVIVLWVFATGLVVGKYRAESAELASLEASRTETSLKTTADVYSAAFENSTKAPPSTSLVAATTVAATDGKTPESWTEKTVLKLLNKAVNNAKKRKSLKLTKQEKVSMKLTDCSESALKIALNNIVQIYTGDRETIYKFKNGIATDRDGNTVTPKDILLPVGDKYNLTLQNISYAAAQKQGNNVKITVTIGKETVDYTKKPLNHSAGIGSLDFTKLDLSPATLDSATVTYERTNITAVVTPKGKLISITASLPVVIKAQGKLGKDFSATVKGSMKWSWRAG